MNIPIALEVTKSVQQKGQNIQQELSFWLKETFHIHFINISSGFANLPGQRPEALQWFLSTARS
jgi:hypothetical protein